jgi:hypothetical protein
MKSFNSIKMKYESSKSDEFSTACPRCGEWLDYGDDCCDTCGYSGGY